jgi:NADP-dependent 3-hydroxy acid dehydrogenase YdfG
LTTGDLCAALPCGKKADLIFQEGNVPMETGLRNKMVLITGAASGIGVATARAFAAEGVHLALIDINKRSLYELAGDLRNGSTVVSLAVADLSTWEGVERGIEEVLPAHGNRIDVLVNNVGVCSPRSFDQTTDDDWLNKAA